MARRSGPRLSLFSLGLLLLLLILPLAAGPPPLVRFAVIGDSGTGDVEQYRVAHQMMAWDKRLPFSLVLMLGDDIYGGLFGGGSQKDFARKFDKPYQPLLSRGVVFRAALGNHDVRTDNGAALIADHDRFHIDGPQGYYSFTAGAWTAPDGQTVPLVEFFVLNTTRLEKDKQDPDQLAWLKQALDDSRARWRILYGHHPLYSTGRRHGSDLLLRGKLEPLFAGSEPPRVHVVLAGHDHIYERFHPQRGVLYFVCGSSGQLRRGNAAPSPELAAVEDEKHVFMLWEASPQELRFRAINEKGRAFDCGVVHPEGKIEAESCQQLNQEELGRGRP